MISSRLDEEADGQTIVPVVHEEPAIRKRVVETGSGIRIAKTVSERKHVDVLLERVRVGRLSTRQIFQPSATKARR